MVPATLVLLVSLVLLAPAAAAETDTTPPRLRALSVDPTSVDVSERDASATISATITDAGSGVADCCVFVSFRSPGGVFAGATLQRAAGDQFSGTMIVPAASESGTWRLISFTASDRAGNVRSMFGSTLVALGFTTTLEVRGAGGGDTTPPRLRALAVDPVSVDVSSEDASVTLSATVTDAESGVGDCCVFVSFRSPSGAFVGGSLQRTTRDEFSGLLRVPANSEAGRWKVSNFSANDRAGNTRSIFGATLVALGFTTSLEVRSAGGGDTTPPRLRALSLDPASVDVSEGEASVTVSATVTDAGSGVAECCVFVSFRSPSRGALTGAILHRLAGDEFSGLMRVAAASEPGLWKLDGFNANDRAGNVRSIVGATLVALGFTTSLRVGSAPDPPAVDAAPPRLVSVRLSPERLDVTAGPGSVAVSATITDESGVSCCPTVSLRSPSGAVLFGSLFRTSSDEFEGSVEVPSGTESGRWWLDQFQLGDAVGNFVFLNRFDLADLGFELGVDVAGRNTVDDAPPRIVSLRLEPDRVDVNSGSASVAVFATITDDTGTSCCPSLIFRSPSGAQVAFGSLFRTSGDVFEGSVQFPAGAESGRWRLDQLQLGDALGNFVFLNRFDLADLGFEIAVEVTGRDTVDAAPPRLVAMRFAPERVDVSAGPASVAVSATITDETDVGCCPSFSLRSPSGRQAVAGSLLRAGGDEFEGTVVFPAGVESGRWRLEQFQLGDVVGNFVFLNRFDLADLGFELGVDVGAANVAPRVEAGADRTLDEGADLDLEATFVDDDAGDTHTATIDWGDGSQIEARPAGNDRVAGRHAYADDGTYSVTVTVTDGDGATGSDTLTATVLNVAPSVDAGANAAGAEGSAFAVHATFSDPGAADTHTAAVDWGDGSQQETAVAVGGQVSASHTYIDDGRYTVTVTVADSDGASASDTLTATIANVAPSATAGGPYEGTPLAPIVISGDATDPGVRDTLEYAWDFEYDGTFSADATGVDLRRPSHTYVFPGTYAVALRVRDDDGGESTTATAAVTIRLPTSTPALVTGSLRWSRDVSTLLEVHSEDGRSWGQVRFEGDGRTIAVTAIDAVVVAGPDVVVFARADDELVRIDAHDGGNPGAGDTLRLRLAGGYDSGILTQVTGNLVVHGS